MYRILSRLGALLAEQLNGVIKFLERFFAKTVFLQNRESGYVIFLEMLRHWRYLNYKTVATCSVSLFLDKHLSHSFRLWFFHRRPE